MITIRRAREEDCSAVICVHTNAVRAISTTHYTLEEIESWAIPRKVEDYQQSIRDKEFYVATEDDIVGFGVLNRETHEVEALYVSPELKGQGVGLKLLEQLEEIARSLRIETLSLNASMNAVGFYQRAGFVAHEESTYLLASGVLIRCVPMTKALVPKENI